ncbi:MAG: YitT family protein [Syntrophomonadaceae bacterium]|nr:YitT family protein [Syntrophomonadaceae bacterium]
MKLQRWSRVAVDYLGITLGAAILASGLSVFLVPNRIAAGGVSGAATIIHYLFNLPVGMVILILNIPLFLLSLRELGFAFGLRSFYGTVVLGFFVDLFTARLAPLTMDVLLAAIYGGVVVGIGMGLVFRFKGTTGGTDLAARIINKYIKVSLGQSLLAIDFLVIAAAGVFFNPELAMYALLSLFVATQVIDLVQEGASFAKAALIISSKTEEITRGIFSELDRGVTTLKGRGMYTGTEHEVIYCVVTRSEVTRLKELVNRIDPLAFVVFNDVREVIGEGFKRKFL